MRSERRLALAVAFAIVGCGAKAEVEETPAAHAEPPSAAMDLAKRARSGDASVGAQACAIVREHPVDPRQPRIPEEVLAAYAVLAAKRTECAELAAALVDVACDPRLDCGPPDELHLCTPEDLQELVDRVLGELAAGHAVPSDVDDRRLLLAAGHALPALPGRVRKQSDRRRYALVQPDDPLCTAGSAAPCKCIQSAVELAEASCASTHSDEHDVGAGCRVRVDDARHEIVVLRASR